ncbi:PBSX family phage terminase large subunit [Campylobacterota bacterium]
MVCEIDLSDARSLMNEKALHMLRLHNRYLIHYGGAGSGKSYSTTQVLLIRLMRQCGHRFLVARKYATSLKRSVFQLFLDLMNAWGVRHLFKVNMSDLTMTCVNGSQIIFVGLDDVEKLKSIAGITSIWIEEASEITLEDFTQLDLRLRGISPDFRQVVLTFNPVSSLSWLKRRFFDTSDNDAHIIHSTFMDNKFLDEHYRKTLENLIGIDKNAYRVYALGEWGTLEGLIYDKYSIVDELPEDYQFRRYGLDFGFNHPMALVEVRFDEEMIYVQELYYRSKSTTDDLIAFMIENNISRSDPIYCDSAEPDRIEAIKRAGFNTLGARKNVRAGIDAVKCTKIHVTKSSVNLIKEVDNYRWKEDKHGNSLEEPVKFMDDLCDSLRYCVFTDEQYTSNAIAASKKFSGLAGFTNKLDISSF